MSSTVSCTCTSICTQVFVIKISKCALLAVWQCAKPCGGGIQYRMVVCQAPDTGVNHDVTDCDMTSRPTASQQCNTQRCDNVASASPAQKKSKRRRYPKWYRGRWSQVRFKTCH